jgi:hypothetical protein
MVFMIGGGVRGEGEAVQLTGLDHMRLRTKWVEWLYSPDQFCIGPKSTAYDQPSGSVLSSRITILCMCMCVCVCIGRGGRGQICVHK